MKYGPRHGEITLTEARKKSDLTQYASGKAFDHLCARNHARLGKTAKAPYAKCRYVSAEWWADYVSPPAKPAADPPPEPEPTDHTDTSFQDVETVVTEPAPAPAVVDPGIVPNNEDWADIFAGNRDPVRDEEITDAVPPQTQAPLELTADDYYSAAELAEILEDVPGFREKPKASKALCKAAVRRMKAHGISNAGIDYGIMGAALAAILAPTAKSHLGNNRAKKIGKDQFHKKDNADSITGAARDYRGRPGSAECGKNGADLGTAASEHAKNDILDSYNIAGTTD